MLSCNSNKVTDDNAMLFQELPFEQFTNRNTESELMNAFVYEYFYNGAGLTAGDVNNDGLLDLYFVSNQEENKLFINQGDFKFLDITNTAKVGGRKDWATSATFVDINLDGLLDIYVCYSGPFVNPDNRKNELYLNQGFNKKNTPTFVEQAANYKLDAACNSTEAVFFDFDQDADLDLYLLNHNPQRITKAALKTGRNKKDNLGGDLLFENVDGNYIDVTSKLGILSNGISYGLGITIDDFNQDGYPDIYVANDYEEMDYFYLNNEGKNFKLLTSKALPHLPYFSMGCSSGDFDNNGFPDIITLDMMASNIVGVKSNMASMNPKKFYDAIENDRHIQYMYNAIQMNNGVRQQDNIPFFSDVAQMSGLASTDWSWSPTIADFDQDGYLDIYITNGIKRNFRNKDYLQKLEQDMKNPTAIKSYLKWTQNMPNYYSNNMMFKGGNKHSFFEKSNWLPSKKGLTHGAIAVDLDNDGDLDIVQNNMDAFAKIYRNLSKENNATSAVQITLEGNKKNSNGLGTKIQLYSSQGDIFYTHQLSSGYLSSVNTNTINIGIGQKTIDSIKVIWPSGKMNLVPPIKTNKYTIKETTSKSDYARKKNKAILQQQKTNILHQENKFDDFSKQVLLPHKLSCLGPALCTGDLDGDGNEEVFLGGAVGYKSRLFTIKNNGLEEIKTPSFDIDINCEDLDACFVDINTDGHLDLYVVSGGNEYKTGSDKYLDRVYLNNGKGQLTNRVLVEGTNKSGAIVKPYDYDQDGDQDVFVGTRLKPWEYPNAEKSMILENVDGKLQSITTKTENLLDLGMVTDAVWSDLDGDNSKELLLVGEWSTIKALKYEDGDFSLMTDIGFEESGWWNCITAVDIDNDGDEDYLLGNLGKNTKYKATKKFPFRLYYSDFDKNGTDDIVLNHFEDGKEYPLRGKACSSEQMPILKKQFTSYQVFAESSLKEVYGNKAISNANVLEATTFESKLCINHNGKLDCKALPKALQISSINDIEVIDQPNGTSALLVGNTFHTEVETPRQDAFYGAFINIKKDGSIVVLPHNKSNFITMGDAKKIASAYKNKKAFYIVANNSGPLQIFSEK